MFYKAEYVKSAPQTGVIGLVHLAQSVYQFTRPGICLTADILQFNPVLAQIMVQLKGYVDFLLYIAEKASLSMFCHFLHHTQPFLPWLCVVKFTGRRIKAEFGQTLSSMAK